MQDRNTYASANIVTLILWRPSKRCNPAIRRRVGRSCRKKARRALAREITYSAISGWAVESHSFGNDLLVTYDSDFRVRSPCVCVSAVNPWYGSTSCDKYSLWLRSQAKPSSSWGIFGKAALWIWSIGTNAQRLICNVVRPVGVWDPWFPLPSTQLAVGHKRF